MEALTGKKSCLVHTQARNLVEAMQWPSSRRGQHQGYNGWTRLNGIFNSILFLDDLNSQKASICEYSSFDCVGTTEAKTLGYNVWRLSCDHPRARESERPTGEGARGRGNCIRNYKRRGVVAEWFTVHNHVDCGLCLYTLDTTFGGHCSVTHEYRRCERH